MRKGRVIVFSILMTLAVLSGCASKEVQQTRQMPINGIDLQSVKDGEYQGDYSYSNFTYVVNVVVQNHHMTAVHVLKNRTTKKAKMAEGVIPRIIERQKNDVDVVSGATTTSKALLKAIENALSKGK
jgi:uncharacterized protein with FMN-binding domain